MSVNNQIAVKKEIIDSVAVKVKQFVTSGDLVLPSNYIAENAIKSAGLMLQELVDKDYKPVLETCTPASIANSLLGMVVQGLNPDKKQCYFIAYGKKLTLQRSYFGSMHVAKLVDEDIVDIFAKTVYEDDEFEYEIKRGKEIVTLHKQKLGNKDKKNIIGAYATIVYSDDRELSTVMTIEEIKQAWKQSKMNPVDANGVIKPGSTHDKFTADMCEKTVINKACKYVINGSSDSSIVTKFAKETDSASVEAEVEEEIENNANKNFIDIESDEIIDVDVKNEPIIVDSEVVENKEPY